MARRVRSLGRDHGHLHWAASLELGVRFLVRRTATAASVYDDYGVGYDQPSWLDRRDHRGIARGTDIRDGSLRERSHRKLSRSKIFFRSSHTFLKGSRSHSAVAEAV